MTNSWKGAGDSLKVCFLIAEDRNLCEWLGILDAQSDHFRVQLRYIRDNLEHKELEFRYHAAEYYCVTIEKHKLSSETDYERGIERGRTREY